MSTARSLETVASGAPSPLGASARARILAYIGVLIFLLGFGGPYLGLIDVPISFFLKNKFHLAAHQVALFRLMSAIPLYLSFLFGFARDRWNPLGRGDRGLIIIFGAVTSAIYVAFAFIPVSYLTLLFGVVILTCLFQFVLGAQNGLVSQFGQQHVMSGQMSAVMNVVQSLPLLGAFLMGGILSQALEGRGSEQAARILFLVGAGVMAVVALYGLWRPKIVYDHLHSERNPELHPLQDLRRLARHWPIYPAMLVWFLWNFAPGSVTPLMFFLQNKLHATDAQWGQWNAIFVVSFIPTFMLFGVLCRRFPLRTLLFWGAAIGVPQMIPMAFIHSVTAALLVAVPMGLMGGVVSAAYIDLLIRSSPKGLQGTTLMLSVALYWIVSRFGDVLGTYLYDLKHDFTICVVAITVVYALMLPALLLVPRRLIATPDGEVPEGEFAA